MCEGYTDVIGFFQAGVPRAVATCGTALAEEHFTLLRNFGRRIVLAYDADGAGQSATSRVYEWERRHEVDVVVADLPERERPGRPLPERPRRLARAVAEARPFLQFRVDRILSAGDLPRPRAGPGRPSRPDAVAEHPDVLGARPVRHAALGPLPARCAAPARTARGPARPTRRPRAEPGEVARHRNRSRSVPRPRRGRDPDDGDVGDGTTGRASDCHGAEGRARARGAEAGGAPPRRGGRSTATRPLRRRVAARRVHRVGAARRSSRCHRAGVTRSCRSVASGDRGRAARRGPRVRDPVDLVVGVLLREAVRRATLRSGERRRTRSGRILAGGAAVTAQVRHWLDELEDPGSVPRRGGSVGSVAYGAGAERRMTELEWCG